MSNIEVGKLVFVTNYVKKKKYIYIYIYIHTHRYIEKLTDVLRALI